MDPKNEKKMEEKKVEEVKKAEGEAQAVTPQQAQFWSFVQNTRLLHVSDLAAFKVGNGLAVVPVDNLSRPLLDSTLYLSPHVLAKLTDAMEKLVEETEEQK